MTAAATPRRIYLVRHAQPQLPDQRRRFLGQTDLPLSERGIEQTGLLAVRLREIPFAAGYCSDLERARRTAAILLEGRAVDLRQRKWLREIDAGAWDLLTFEEARERYPLDYAAREADLAGTPFPGGESLADVEARVVPGFLGMVEESAGDLLVVGHRAVNVVLLSHLLGRPLRDAFTIKQEYLEVNVITTGEGGDGRRWFDVAPAGSPT